MMNIASDPAPGTKYVADAIEDALCDLDLVGDYVLKIAGQGEAATFEVDVRGDDCLQTYIITVAPAP